MQEIVNWIQGTQDYNEGLKLYEKHIGENFLFSLLKSGPTPYNIDTLKDKLQELVVPIPDSQNIDIPTQLISEPIAQQAIIFEKPKSEQYPEYLKIKREIEELYMQANRAKFVLNTTKKERKPLLFATAKQIKKIQRTLTEKFMLIDYFDEHGCFPVKDVVVKPAMDPAVEIQLLRQSNSKAKKRLSNPDYKNKVQTEKLILANNARIEELKKILNRK